MLFPTTIAGSLPKPEWLAEPNTLWAPWKSKGEELTRAKRDATMLAVKLQEDAGIDIVTEGEQARQGLEAAIQKVRLEQAGQEVPQALAAVHTGPDPLPPGTVVEVPAHGLGQSGLKGLLRYPAKVATDLGWIDGVALVVTGPVAHEGDQVLARADPFIGSNLVDRLLAGGRGLVASQRHRPQTRGGEVCLGGIHHVDVLGEEHHLADRALQLHGVVGGEVRLGLADAADHREDVLAARAGGLGLVQLVLGDQPHDVGVDLADHRPH